MKRFLFLLSFCLVLAGCDPAAKPEVQIPEIKDLKMSVSSRSIQLTATYTLPAAVTGCGAEVEGPQGAGVLRAEGNEDGIFTLRADGLKPDSDYRVRAFIENGRQARFTDWTNCHTPPLPAISVKAESSVFSATLQADIAGTGQKGFLFGESEATLEPYPFADGTLHLHHLNPAHRYCFAAFVEVDGTKEVSDIQYFDTKDIIADLQADLDESFCLRLSARPLYGDEVTPEAAGFFLGTNPSALEALDSQTAEGEWKAQANGLAACKTYYYCAYVTVDGREYRSPLMHFETGFLPFEDAVFWEYILGNYDTDRNGQLSQAEADKVAFLPLFNLGIHSLSGIENFRNLNEIQMEENELTRLDLSALPDPKIEGFVLRTPHLEALVLPAVKAPETKYGGHFEVRSNALRGHWEFPVYAAREVIIEAPLSSIGLDKIQNDGATLMLTLTGTEIEELDLSQLAVTLTYANLCGNEKLKVVWLPYGEGSTAMIVKDPHTQIKYK